MQRGKSCLQMGRHLFWNKENSRKEEKKKKRKILPGNIWILLQNLRGSHIANMFKKKEKFWFHRQLPQTSHCNAWRRVNWGRYLVYCFVVTVMKIIHYSVFLSCKTVFSPLHRWWSNVTKLLCMATVVGADQHFYCFLLLSHVSALILVLKAPSTNTISSLWFWAPSRKKTSTWSRPETPKHEDNTSSTQQQQNNVKNVDFCFAWINETT